MKTWLNHKFPHSVDISLKVREEPHCLAEIAHFWWQKPRSWAKKPILMDESTGFEALEVVVRVVCVAKMQRRCWSCYHDRRALVYIADPVHRGLQEDAIEIAKHMVSFHFFQFRSIPKYPRNIPDLSNLGTSNPLVNHPFPWWAQLVG